MGTVQISAADYPASQPNANMARGCTRLRSIAAFWLLGIAAWAQAPSAKVVGTVKTVNASSAIVTTDSGSEITVSLSDSTRIVRAPPGQTDLKSAGPIAISEIEIGDRVFARGQPGEGSSVIASSVVVMKKGEIAERQQRERDEWRKGVGGIVKVVDPGGSTITIANSMLASGKPIVVHLLKDASVRRYAPDSVKFDDAKTSTLDQIKPGDQLRARGTKNSDETEFTAQAIVSGSFRDIAGTVVSTNPAENSITVTDLVTKKPVTVKVSADSQLRKLPQMVAMGIAMRLKGGMPGGQAPGTSGAAGVPAPAQGNNSFGGGNWNGGQVQGNWRNGAGNAGGGSGMPGGPGANWRGSGGPPDFQQMLSRMPAVEINELNKGDAVMLVATEGSTNSAPTAITLLAGVEPILTAAPPGMRASAILAPWNLGAPAGAGGDTAGP